MNLHRDWKRIVKRAWSMRLMGLAGVLTGCEAVINTIGVDFLPLAPKWRELLILAVIAAAFVARLIAQKGVSDDAR